MERNLVLCPFDIVIHSIFFVIRVSLINNEIQALCRTQQVEEKVFLSVLFFFFFKPIACTFCLNVSASQLWFSADF